MQNDYYDKTLDRFASWITHQDTKAGLALVILGIASADLLDHATQLADAHKLPSGWGDVATAAFWLAVTAAAATVVFAWLTILPRIKPGSGPSLFFFRTVAGYRTHDEFRAAAAGLSDAERERHLAAQVWELARHATAKARYARLSYMTVLAFLVLWGLSRVALSLAA